jgi:hypothetical protein
MNSDACRSSTCLRSSSRSIPASSAVLVLLRSVVAAALVATLVAGQWLPSVSLLIGSAAVGFISTLIWHLAHSPPPATVRPDLAPIVLPKLGFYRMLSSIVAALLVLFIYADYASADIDAMRAAVERGQKEE